MRLVAVMSLAALWAAGPATARPLSPDQVSAIAVAADKALADTGVPSASVAVVRDGEIVYAAAFGHQRPGQAARPDARYPIASVSKQFTAAAVLLLAEDGKLSLDDRVSKHLPDLPHAGEVTIRQLLSHTAGYRDYWPQDYAFADMRRPVTPAEILDRWAKAPLDFAPGSQWQYSNTGYVAAGQIVEKVSGRPLLDFLRTRVFQRLGMTPVDLDTGLTAADPIGYERFALGPVRPAAPAAPGWLYAAGPLAMTASDLARWDISVIDRSVMSLASYAEQQREVVLTNGVGTRYGLGVDVVDVRGHRRISHAGEAVGFTSENRIYPDDRAAIVVLDNADFGDATTAIADAIEREIFAESRDVGRARSLYDAMRRGAVDRASLTANGALYFTDAVLEDYRTSLGRLGEPKSFVRTNSALRGGFTVERFIVDYGDRKLQVILRAEPGPQGRVEEFMVSPIS